MVRVVVNPWHMVVAGEVRVLGWPWHVVLGVEVEAGMPDGTGIHVGVLIQKIAYIHLLYLALRSCCADALRRSVPKRPGVTQRPPLLRRAHLGALGSCVPGPGTSLPTGFYWAQPLAAFALKGRVAFQSAGTPAVRGDPNLPPPRVPSVVTSIGLSPCHYLWSLYASWFWGQCGTAGIVFEDAPKEVTLSLKPFVLQEKGSLG